MSIESQFNFHYFDQECDFGIETAAGEFIRKKKKPGRKPNPPTAEKKRAQNRASQKAYRQRKSEKKEEETKLRQDFARQIKDLKRQLEQSRYEANYLRAIVLHLMMSSIMDHGSVPHSWMGDSKGSQLPGLLDAFLENNHILELERAKQSTFRSNTCDKNCYIPQTYELSHHEPQAMLQDLHDFSESESPGSSDYTKLYESRQSTPNESDTITKSENENEYTNRLMVHKKPLKGVLLNTPTLKTADDFVSMSPLQAIHISRLQLKVNSIMGHNALLSLVPTTLQKIVPHDIRIDYLPGALIRDRMILFQDYYDIDDCFQYLTQSLVFTGGDICVLKNWSMDPNYSAKFWFFSHELMAQHE